MTVREANEEIKRRRKAGRSWLVCCMISTASTTLTRPKSLNSMGTIVVDMGDNPRGNGSDSLSIAGGPSSAADSALQRLKSNGAIGVDSYSPVKSKTSRGLVQSPENVSVIHCIPLLMVFVFFILWTASSGMDLGSDSSSSSSCK